MESSETEDEDEREERLTTLKRRQLVEKLKQHSILKRIPSVKEKALTKIVNQINWAWELDHLLQKNVSRIGTRPKRSLSVSERVVESALTARDLVLYWIWDILIVYVFPVVGKVFVLGLMSHRIAAEMLLLVLEWRARPRYAALKDISATAQQFEIRLQQFCYWPMQYVTLQLRKNDWESVTTSHPDYIRFYNSLWLVANDVIIGIALGSYIIDNAGWVADQISNLLSMYTVEALQRSISWLMGWPAGLKLNNELAAFLGDLFLWVIDYWSSECFWYSQLFAVVTGTNSLFGSRLHRHPPSSPAASCLVHRFLELRRGQYAHRPVFRPLVHPDNSHILILPSICAHLQLATRYSDLSLSPLPWKEAQRSAKPYRLVRL